MRFPVIGCDDIEGFFPVIHQGENAEFGKNSTLRFCDLESAPNMSI
jgi:hypothetical protein